jgi:membrane fusion protein, heavy metal efflux system
MTSKSYNGFQPCFIGLRLCSGTLKGAATQTKPSGCTLIIGNLLYRSPSPAALSYVSSTLLSLVLITSPTAVLAHAGHGDEFHSGGETTQVSDSIQVDGETAKRLGIKVEPVTRQQLAIGIKTTGQIETLPSQKVEVTAPIPGKVVELLVEPGADVKAGQTIAVIAAPELVELRVNSAEKRAEAIASLQQAQANLKLAQENYARQQTIAASEIAQARIQLAAAQKQYNRDLELVNQKAVLKVAQENYQRQLRISEAEIARAKTELAVAQEKYDRDRELVAQGGLPRRQMLESEAHLAAAKASLVKALGRPEVIQAETEVKRAEVDLPWRDLRESESKLAEAKALLTKALSRREVLEASAELKRSSSAVEVAKSRINLSNETYQTRLQQLGTRANNKGMVTITAPISGKVADREVSLGQSFEDAGGKLMTIVNDSRVFATANIYEKDLNQVKAGQKVRVKVASLPNQTFSGQITIIGSVVEGETRIVPVKAELKNAGGVLKPGMFAELEVLTDTTSNAILALPSSAIIEANGKKIVYIQNGNAYQPVEVNLGQTSGDMVEVKTGLFEGDLIVTQRVTQLYAQSLRGGSKAGEKGSKGAGEKGVNFSWQNGLPWWFFIPIGGAIASATFWAGTVWAHRKIKPNPVAIAYIESDIPTYQIPNSKHPTLSRSSVGGEHQEPHQPN